jgi:hypothetical protein
VVDGYTLMFAAFLLAAGSLVDRIGAKAAFGIGTALFVAASAACGLAPNLATLVTFRFVQGAGAAVIMPASILVGTRDGKVIPMRAGDTVWTPPGEEHWHGGTTDTFMCHIAMLEAADGDPTTWLEPVDDQTYQAANPA